MVKVTAYFLPLLLLIFEISTAYAQYSLKNALVPGMPRSARNVSPSSGGHTVVELIDVKCDTKSAMQVTVEFDSVFSGVIYSQGYFNDEKCRYVKTGGNDKVYTFQVPYEGCGSKPSCTVCASVDNILVIQSDEHVQEAWDTARRITCSRKESAEKTIYFKPFVVEMLEVVNVPTLTGAVECWMDIQRGTYPKISAIPDIIKIGETLSVLVYLKDVKNEYDLVVRDCWAYDNEDYGAKSTGKLQLSDGNGCSRKKKLFGGWQKSTSTGNSGATLVLHNTLYAFKFPDKGQVFLKCDIEICKNGCDEPICEGGQLIGNVENDKPPRLPRPTQARPVPTRPAATRPPRPQEVATRGSISTEAPVTRVQQVRERVTRPPFVQAETDAPVTTLGPLRCFQGSEDPRCQRTRSTGLYVERVTQPQIKGTRAPVTRAPIERIPNPSVNVLDDADQVTRQPQRSRTRPTRPVSGSTYLPPTTEFVCEPGSTDGRCPPVCDPNRPNRDPRCPKPSTTPRPVVTTRPPFRCGPDTQDDPRCIQPSTYLPPTTTPEPFKCGPNNLNDPRCPPVCNPRGRNTDPRCPKRETTRPVTTTPAPFRCGPRTQNDPRCTTTQRPTTVFQCTPGSLDPRCPPVCDQFEENDDPRCPRKTTQRAAIPTEAATYLPPTTRQTTTTTRRPVPTTTAPFRCGPRTQNDPRCTTTARPTTVFQCGPDNQNDARCAPVCNPNGYNSDPRCPQPTTTTQRTTTVFRCAPGSTDERCPPVCNPNGQNADPRCPKPTTPRPTTTTQRATTVFQCAPGSTDRRCPPVCNPNGQNADPRCPQPTTQRAAIPTEAATYLPPTTKKVTQPPNCYPGSSDLRCPVVTRPTTRAPFRCGPSTQNDPRCTTTQRPTTVFQCTPGSTDKRCPPVCNPNGQNTDPRCPQPTTQRAAIPTEAATYLPPTTRSTTTTRRPVPTTTAPFRCGPSTQNDPRCTTTQRPTTVFQCTPGSTDKRCPPVCNPNGQNADPRCPKPTTPRPTTTTPRATTVFQCAPGSTDRRCPPVCNPNGQNADPRCPQPTTQRAAIPTEAATYLPPTTARQTTSTTRRPVPTTTAPFRCGPSTQNDPRCTTTQRPTTVFQCTPGSTDKRCPPVCNPNGQNADPRCPKPTTPRPTTTTSRTTTVFQCAPGSTDRRCPPVCNPNGQNADPRCPKPTTPRPTTARAVPTEPATYLPPTTTRQTTTTRRPIPTTTAPFRCGPSTQNDPRCTTTQRPTTVFQCTPGSTDKRCPPVCNPNGQNADPRCPRPTTPRPTTARAVPTEPATYLPPTTTRQTTTTRRPVPTTTAPFRCGPSTQNDPRCTTTQRPTTVFKCAPGSTDKRCPPVCNPNGQNSDPRCPKPTTPRPSTARDFPTTQANTYLPPSTTRQATTPRPTPAFQCTPGSTDKRCPPICNANGYNSDSRCPKPAVTTTQKPPCFPGSKAPYCPQPFTTPRPTQPAPTLASCYPGSRDPKCPQPYAPSSTNVPATYLPPLFSEPNSLNPNVLSPKKVFTPRIGRQITPNLIAEINNLLQPEASDFHEITSSLADKKTEFIYSQQNQQNHLRQKRSISGDKEIISITLNFKGYQFE